jgi:HlyD family secretion protein
MDKKKIIPVIVIAVIITATILYFEVFRKLIGQGSEIEGSGTIEVTEIDISTKIAGRVVDLPRQEGEKIQKGELAARLDINELDAQRDSARANFNNMQKNLKRIRNLFASGSISKKDLDNAEAAYQIAQAGLDQISATIGNAVIYSPISGIVLDTNVDVGEMAFPGTPIVTIADLTKTWMYIYVNETKLSSLKIGEKAKVMIDSSKRPFNGKVVAISNKAEFTPKTIQTKDERVKLVFAVKIAIDNPDMILKPGMPADAEIIR